MKILIWIDKQSFLYKESVPASLICVYVYVRELRRLDYCGFSSLVFFGRKISYKFIK